MGRDSQVTNKSKTIRTDKCPGYLRDVGLSLAAKGLLAILINDKNIGKEITIKTLESLVGEDDRDNLYDAGSELVDRKYIRWGDFNIGDGQDEPRIVEIRDFLEAD